MTPSAQHSPQVYKATATTPATLAGRPSR